MASIFLHQMVDVSTVRFGQRRAFDEQNVFGVELRAARKVVRTGDDGIVDQKNLVVHVIVPAGRTVGR
ncbi:MAG: hypothetical protein DME49_10965 [Verrucomicrobia bacterium]|nr:MAG: hypothetical protein DME49_10965 [Verrucomicrobiota bacterium]